jgi:hypothetical protein
MGNYTNIHNKVAMDNFSRNNEEKVWGRLCYEGLRV